MTRNGSISIVLNCVLMALALSPTASAGLLYSTSYEQPSYVTGPLDGQEGWANSFGIDPVVTSGFARTGVQSLEVRQALDEDPFGLTFRLGPYSTSASRVVVEHSVYLNDGAAWDFISPLVLLGSNGFIAQLAIDDGLTANLGLDEVVPGGVPVATQRWIDLSLVLNFPTQTVEGFVDGVSIGSGAFVSPASQLSQVEIFHIFDFASTGPSSSFFVDDLSISAVPLPSTVLLLVGGLIGLISRRRRAGR